MAGIGVVVNPHARWNRGRTGRVEELRRIVGDDGEVVETFEIGELDEVARRFREAGVDLVAVCGGDGTLSRVLTATRRALPDGPLPAWMPLRAGTINVVADSVRCRRGSPESVLATVVAKRRVGEPLVTTERGTIAVDDDVLGFLFGLGLVVDFLRLYYDDRDPGPRSAAVLLARLAASAVLGTSLARDALPRLRATVDCDGERLPFAEYSVVLGMAIEHLPLGFRPGYLADRTPGRFHVLAGPVSPARIAWALPRLRLGLPLRDAGLHDAAARELRIEFGRPTHYMVDAEILGPVERMRVAAGPRVRFVRG